MKALVQWDGSLIKPRQSQNRISGFSTESVLKPLILFCDRDVSIYYLLKALESRVATDRLGALFGVSILEDKGPHTQSVMGLSCIKCQVKCDFFRLSIFR